MSPSSAASPARRFQRSHAASGEPELPGVLLFRPEAALIYLGVEHVQKTVLAAVAAAPPGSLRHAVCDLSATPNLDVAGTEMLRKLGEALATQGITLSLAGAHARVRDMLRADGLAILTDGSDRGMPLEAAIARIEAEGSAPVPAAAAVRHEA